MLYSRVVALGLLSVTLSWAQVERAAAPIGFTNFELSKTPTIACPGSSLCYNGAAEPAIRADGFGNFYSSSENGLTAGTLAWRSQDGGRHYTNLVSPNSLSSATDSTRK